MGKISFGFSHATVGRRAHKTESARVRLTLNTRMVTRDRGWCPPAGSFFFWMNAPHSRKERERKANKNKKRRRRRKKEKRSAFTYVCCTSCGADAAKRWGERNPRKKAQTRMNSPSKSIYLTLKVGFFFFFLFVGHVCSSLFLISFFF